MKTVNKSALVLILLSAMLAACGDKNFEDSFKDADKYTAKGDYRAAIIELKNALKMDPNSGPARFSLGRALVLTGDMRSALVEFKKAEELGFEKDKVLPELAQVLLQEQQYKKLIEDYGDLKLGSSEARADVLTSVGLAHLALKDAAVAEKIIYEAAALSPRSERAQLAVASLSLQAGNASKALEVVEKLLAVAPNFSRAWVMKGELLGHYMAQRENALAAMQQALKVDKNSIGAYGGIISLSLGLGKLDLAKENLGQMRKRFPNHPLESYYSSLAALKGGDLAEARLHVNKLLKLTPGEPRALELAGAIELQLGSALQAQKYLEQSVLAWPEGVTGRLLLVRTYLMGGNPDKALAALQPILNQQNQESLVSALAAEAYLQRGDLAKAESYFDGATKQDPKDLRSKTALAFVHIERGHPDQGFDELKSLASVDKNDAIDLALINAHLGRGEFDKALAAVDALERKKPQQAEAPALRGRIELAQGGEKAARASFERALALRPDHYLSLVSLANFDVRKGDFDAAVDRVKKVSEKYPSNAEIEAMLIALRRDAGTPPADLLPTLKNLVKKNPNLPKIRLALIGTYADMADTKGALNAAQEGLNALPESAEMLDAVGRMQTAVGDSNQAVSSFSRWAAMQPKSALPHLRLGQMYFARGEFSAAASAFKRANALDPKNFDVMMWLIKSYVDGSKLEDAYSFARLVRLNVDENLGNALLGEIESRQGNWAKAADVYGRLFQREPRQAGWAVKLHHALLLSGKTEEAKRVEAGWRANHSRDGRFVEYLAGEAVLKGEWPRAERLFAELVDQDPGNAGALNNLAWVLGKQGKPDAAEWARKAVKLRPREANYWDTLASLQASAGQMGAAIESEKKAIALDPGVPQQRLTLAEMLIKNGDRQLAKKELDWLSGLGERFDRQVRVKELLEKI